jgi:hypothetical protein
MLTVKSVESRRSKSIKNSDITTKKIEKNLHDENPSISGVSVGLSPGNTDITAKKKIKDLTFVFRCAKRMW